MRLEVTPQVWGVSGNLGGGKTMTAVRVAINALMDGYAVVTNITLIDPPNPSLVFPADLEHDDPSQWPVGDVRGRGRRVMVVLDEVAEWFDQYQGTSQVVKRFLSWLRHSSKRGQDVFLVVQRREYLAKSLRILVARWIWVEDLATFRIPKIGLRIPFASGQVAVTVFDRLGNSVQRTEFITKRIWGRYYNTGQLLAGELGTSYTPPPKTPLRLNVDPWAAALALLAAVRLLVLAL